MKAINLYQCEICGTQYKNRMDARDCEKSHKRVDKVISARYVSQKIDRSGMPISIVVTFEDGSQSSYRRQ